MVHKVYLAYFNFHRFPNLIVLYFSHICFYYRVLNLWIVRIATCHTYSLIYELIPLWTNPSALRHCLNFNYNLTPIVLLRQQHFIDLYAPEKFLKAHKNEKREMRNERNEKNKKLIFGFIRRSSLRKHARTHASCPTLAFFLSFLQGNSTQSCHVAAWTSLLSHSFSLSLILSSFFMTCAKRQTTKR